MEQAKEIIKDVLLEMQRQNLENSPDYKPLLSIPMDQTTQDCPRCGVAVPLVVLLPAVLRFGKKEVRGLDPTHDCRSDAEKEQAEKDASERIARLIEAEKLHAAEEIRRESERIKKLWILSLGGIKAYEYFDFEHFTPRPTIPLDFPDSKNLYIHGPTGSGKTHLGTAIARLAWNHPHGVHVCKPMTIFREMRGLKEPDEEIEIIAGFVRRPVLMIDDLGVSKDTDFSAQVLYEIIDGRYMAMTGGLIVTSNLSLDTLSEKMGDDRIASRLAEMCEIITLAGKDHRLERK